MHAQCHRLIHFFLSRKIALSRSGDIQCTQSALTQVHTRPVKQPTDTTIGYRLTVSIGLLMRETTRVVLIWGQGVPWMADMQVFADLFIFANLPPWTYDCVLRLRV